jgi:hypothetical protein
VSIEELRHGLNELIAWSSNQYREIENRRYQTGFSPPSGFFTTTVRVQDISENPNVLFALQALSLIRPDWVTERDDGAYTICIGQLRKLRLSSP